MIEHSSPSEIDFFVSYARPDRAWADWLAWQLEASGYAVRLQSWDFPAGANFPVEINGLLRDAKHLIAVLSSDYLTSGFAAAEYLAAFARDPTGRKRALIPIRVRDCDPSGVLGSIVYCDLLGLDEDRATLRVLEAVRGGRFKPQVQPGFPGSAQPAFPQPESSVPGRSPLPIYGLDGEPLDGAAANFIRTGTDAQLDRDIASHQSYGVIQVRGAPGQGKSSTLAQLGLRAAETHDLCAVDIEYELARSPLAEDAVGAVVASLRKAHRRCYRDIEQDLLRQRRAWEPQALDPRALPDAVADHLQAAGLLTTSARTRLADLAAAFTSMAVPAGRALLRHTSAQGSDDCHGTSADDYLLPRAPRYGEDDLADELLLTIALADTRALLSAAIADRVTIPPPRRILMLIDNADRADGADVLLAMLRGLRPLVGHAPALKRMLVVVAKTERSASATVHASVLLRWHRTCGFTPDELTNLVSILQGGRWLPPRLTTDAVVQRCQALGAGNRRVTCLYLDRCRNVGRLCSVPEYIDRDGSGDPRLPLLVATWASRAVAALLGVDRDIAGETACWLTHVARESTALREANALEACAPANVRAFAEDFGLSHGAWVPIVQQQVCRQILYDDKWLARSGGSA